MQNQLCNMSCLDPINSWRYFVAYFDRNYDVSSLSALKAPRFKACLNGAFSNIMLTPCIYFLSLCILSVRLLSLNLLIQTHLSFLLWPPLIHYLYILHLYLCPPPSSFILSSRHPGWRGISTRWFSVLSFIIGSSGAAFPNVFHPCTVFGAVHSGSSDQFTAPAG